MQMLCTVIHTAVEYLRPWLWMSYGLVLAAVTGSRLISLWPSYRSSLPPRHLLKSLRGCLAQLLRPLLIQRPSPAQPGSVRRSVLKSCLLRQSAVCPVPVSGWGFSRPLTGIQAAIQRSDADSIYVLCGFFFSFIIESSACTFRVFCLEYDFFFFAWKYSC